MSKLRVMVVHEHKEFREEIYHLMVDMGFEAFPAADGIDALRQIYDVKPQLIVSDAGLSDLSGFQFLPFVKRRFPSIAVIALGSVTNDKQKPVVADMLLPKQPWDPDRLLGSIEELLSRPLAANGADYA